MAEKANEKKEEKKDAGKPEGPPADLPTLPILPPEELSAEESKVWSKSIQKRQSSVAITTPPAEEKHLPKTGGRRASSARRSSVSRRASVSRRGSVSRRASLSRRRSSVGLRRASLSRRRSSVGLRRSSRGTDMFLSSRRRSSAAAVDMFQEEKDPYANFYLILSVVLAVANAAMGTALIYFLMFSDSGPQILKWQLFEVEPPEVIKRPGGDGSQGQCLVVCFYDPSSAEWEASVVLKLDTTPFSDVCTHLVYSDVTIDKDAGGVLDFHRQDLANKLLPKFLEEASRAKTTVLAELRSRDPSDTEGIEATLFPSETPKLDMFSSAVQAFLGSYGFLGLSLDVYNPSSKPGTANRFMQLIKGLKPGLSQQRYLLAVNVYFAKGHDAGLDFKEIVKNVDILILGTHNLLTNNKFTGFPSPLYGPKPNDLSWDSVIDRVVGATESTDRLVAGVPFWGAEFILNKTVPQNEIGTPGKLASNASIGGPYTHIKGMLTFFEICVMIQSEPWKHAVNQDAGCPAMNRGLYWVGYDDAWSIRQKVRYALQRRLAGVAIKNIEMDDWNKACLHRTSLAKTVARQMEGCLVTAKRRN